MRPALLSPCEAVNGSPEIVCSACSELLHTYSLIHDDLPCMIMMRCGVANPAIIWCLAKLYLQGCLTYHGF